MSNSATGTLKYKIYKSSETGVCQGKYYARAVQDRTLDFNEFVTHIADHNSPYSRGVINGVLTDMLSCLQELILDGKSVRLGDLGLFYVGITSTGVENVDDFSVNNIKGVKLHVRNTKDWSNAQLRNLTSLSELTEYTKGTSSSTSDSSSSDTDTSDSSSDTSTDTGDDEESPLG